jgi:hypothetical protein
MIHPRTGLSAQYRQAGSRNELFQPLITEILVTIIGNDENLGE